MVVTALEGGVYRQEYIYMYIEINVYIYIRHYDSTTAVIATLRTIPYATLPSPLLLNVLPALTPRNSPSSSAITPLTSTYLTPSLVSLGSSKVALSLTRAASNRTRSAAEPTLTTPLAGYTPSLLAGRLVRWATMSGSETSPSSRA